jgi:hypothetical protein
MAKVAFYLIKEVGLSHKDIFGETRYVNFVEAEPRGGVLGGVLDYVVGEEKRERTERVSTRGMNVHTFNAYMDLLEEHQEEMEKQKKKQKMRSSVKGTTLGG